MLPIECDIPSLKLVIELISDTTKLEQILIYLEKLDDTRRDVATTNEAHKCQVKAQYEKSIKPRVFCKGDLVLVYVQKNDTLGVEKFVSMWLCLYIVKCVLVKRTYWLVNYEGNPFGELEMDSIWRGLLPR